MLTLVLLTTLGCAIHTGNGESATEDRAVSGFDAVSAQANIHVDVYTGDGEGAVVSCDSNLLEYVITKVEDGTLVVRTPNGTSIAPKADCYVEVQGNGFTSLRTSGSGDMYAEGDFAGLEVGHTSGSGELTVIGIDSKSIELSTSGSGGIEAKGGADSLEVRISGSGDITTRTLTAGDVDVNISGSGDGRVTATDSLKAKLSGSGDLHVYGNPADVDQKASGSGDVKIH